MNSKNFIGSSVYLNMEYTFPIFLIGSKVQFFSCHKLSCFSSSDYELNTETFTLDIL
jgi:hypothetical protein